MLSSNITHQNTYSGNSYFCFISKLVCHNVGLAIMNLLANFFNMRQFLITVAQWGQCNYWLFENWISENLDKLEYVDGLWDDENLKERVLDRDSMIKKKKSISNSTSYGIWFNYELSETEFAHVLIILLNQQTNQISSCNSLHQTSAPFSTEHGWGAHCYSLRSVVSLSKRWRQNALTQYFLSSMSPYGSSKALGSEIYHL